MLASYSQGHLVSNTAADMIFHVLKHYQMSPLCFKCQQALFAHVRIAMVTKPQSSVCLTAVSETHSSNKSLWSKIFFFLYKTHIIQYRDSSLKLKRRCTMNWTLLCVDVAVICNNFKKSKLKWFSYSWFQLPRLNQIRRPTCQCNRNERCGNILIQGIQNATRY